VLAHLFGQTMRDQRHAELRDRVADLARRAFHVDRRRHHQDVPVLLLQHRGQHVVGARERAARVHAHHQIEPLHRRVGQRLPVQRARVVDQEVDAPHLVERRLHAGLDLRVVAHVDADGERAAPELLDLGRRVVDRAGQARVRLLGLGGHDHVATFARERERDALADATRGTSDEGHAIFEQHGCGI
jgi:hypothetical protein